MAFDGVAMVELWVGVDGYGRCDKGSCGVGLWWMLDVDGAGGGGWLVVKG